MFRVVDTTCDVYVAVWTPLVPFATAVAAFKAKIKAIEDEIETQSTELDGYAMDKGKKKGRRWCGRRTPWRIKCSRMLRTWAIRGVAREDGCELQLTRSPRATRLLAEVPRDPHGSERGHSRVARLTGSYRWT